MNLSKTKHIITRTVTISCISIGKRPVNIYGLGLEYGENKLLIYNFIEYDYGKERLPILLKEKESFTFSLGKDNIKNVLEDHNIKITDKFIFTPYATDNTNNYYYGSQMEIALLKE